MVNLITDLDTGDDGAMAFRGALHWLVNDDIEANISGDYSFDRENDQARVPSQNPGCAIQYFAGGELRVAVQETSHTPIMYHWAQILFSEPRCPFSLDQYAQFKTIQSL